MTPEEIAKEYGRPESQQMLAVAIRMEIRRELQKVAGAVECARICDECQCRVQAELEDLAASGEERDA